MSSCRNRFWSSRASSQVSGLECYIQNTAPLPVCTAPRGELGWKPGSCWDSQTTASAQLWRFPLRNSRQLGTCIPTRSTVWLDSIARCMQGHEPRSS